MTHRPAALIVAMAAALSGCAASSGREAAVASVETKRAKGWAGFVDGFVERYMQLFPSFAVAQGRHDYDGRLPDWSDAGLAAQIAFLEDAGTRAKAFDASVLTPEQRFERDYLIAQVDRDLFWLRDADDPHRNPAYYLQNGLDPNVYVARPYASAAVRLRALTAFAQRIPQAAAQIRANLRTPMPRSFIDYGVAGFGGLADYYATDAKAAFASVKDEALQAEYDIAAEHAASAMRGLATWLETQRKSATEAYALGPEKFQHMLWATERVDTPITELERIGWADLRRNQAALKAACARYLPGATVQACMAKMQANKSPKGPVAEARDQLVELRRFLDAKQIVTIPGREEALVNESPPYNRQNSAYIDIPGPYETGLPSVYYISPPDPKWTKEVQDAFVPARADLLFTSVHEVWPGHFLNFLHSNRSKFQFGKLFVGYAYAEGWGHYTEELMWEAGLGDGDPEVHIGQLSNALLRNLRFLSAIGLHAKGMTVEQSRRLFRDEGYQDEGTARQQAARGTYDPAYLNYTLGKLMIMRLRADWTASRGGRDAWRAFHDAFLSYGGPPIPLVRQQMIGGDAAAVF